MASTAISSQGSSLSIGGADIVNIVSFTGFDGEAPEIDVSNLQSSAKEYLLGLTDGGGGFTIELHPEYGDAGQDALRSAEVSGAVSTFILTLRDNTTITFDALVKNAHNLNGSVDAALAGSCSLKVTGPLTIAPQGV
jgi:hypothetical protein